MTVTALWGYDHGLPIDDSHGKKILADTVHKWYLQFADYIIYLLNRCGPAVLEGNTEGGDDHLVRAPRGAVALVLHPVSVRQLPNFGGSGIRPQYN